MTSNTIFEHSILNAQSQKHNHKNCFALTQQRQLLINAFLEKYKISEKLFFYDRDHQSKAAKKRTFQASQNKYRNAELRSLHTYLFTHSH